MSTPSQPPDSRFLALRYAAQEASDFQLPDDTVRRFIELRDEGAEETDIAGRLGVDPELAQALVRADEAQALAHRIATGAEPMYPPPAPADRVVDDRSGSAIVPVAAVGVLVAGALLWALLR